MVQGCSAMRELRPAEGVRVILAEGTLDAILFRQKSYAVVRADGPWRVSGEKHIRLLRYPDMVKQNCQLRSERCPRTDEVLRPSDAGILDGLLRIDVSISRCW